MLTHYPTLSAVSAALSFNRQRLYQIAKRPGFPPKGPKGYEVEQVLAFLTAEGLQTKPSVNTPAAADNRNLTDLKADLLKEQIAKLKFQNQVEQRQYIAKEEIASELTRIIHQFKSVLYAALENELPPILEGMKAADIQVKTRGALAEAFRTIETDKWATKK
jgi:hypothetical protein